MTFAETWSPVVLERLQEDLLVSKITNRNYQGDVKGGNAVNIFGVVLPAVTDYVRTGENGSSAHDNSKVKMLIDKEKWTSEYVDGVSATQVPYDMEQRAVLNTALAMAEFMESEVMTYIHTLAPKLTAATLTKDTVYSTILTMKKTLKTNKVPVTGRFLICTPDMEVAILESNKMVPTADPKQLADGMIGRIGGFDVYVSNDLGEIANAQLLAGHSLATTMGIGVAKMMKKDVEDGDGVKVQNLTVYGRLVTTPTALIAINSAG